MANLPEINFVTVDPAEIEREVIAGYESVAGRTLAPGDPVRLWLERVAFDVALLRAEINDTGRQNLLEYARGDMLDHLGDFLGVDRLSATAATVTVRFSISSVLGYDVAIPAGTRVSPDGSLIFAIDEAATITAGNTTVDVAATCEAAGSAGNGYIAGQIATLVDSVANISSVSNTTLSLGGSDAETDDHYRERIRLAPESFSVAGPSLAYVFHALGAHQDISDATATSPTPGNVVVTVLLTGGQIPAQSYLDLVEAAVNGEKARPLTDQVTVQAATAVSYNINLTYYVSTDYAAIEADIDQAVTDAVEAFQAWQKARLGRDINPAELTRRIQEITGIKRVTIASPVHLAVYADEIAAEGTTTITDGGLESG